MSVQFDRSPFNIEALETIWWWSLTVVFDHRKVAMIRQAKPKKIKNFIALKTYKN